MNHGVGESVVLPLMPLAVGGPVATYDDSSLAFFAALATQPSHPYKNIIDTFVRSLKSGGVWSGFDTLYVLASEADGVGNFGINLVNPGTYTLTNTNTPTWTQYVGTQGNGTSSYHNMNVVMSTLANFVHNNCSIGCWVNVLNTTGVMLVRGFSTTDSLVKATVSSPVNWTVRLNTGTNQVANNSTPYDTVPHSFIGSRTGSTATNLYYDGVVDEAESAQLSEVVPQASSCGIHGDGANYGNAQIAFAFLGRGFNATEVLAIHNAMSAANTSLAAL